MVFTVDLRRKKSFQPDLNQNLYILFGYFFGLDRLVLNSLVRIYRQPCLILILRLMYNSGFIKELGGRQIHWVNQNIMWERLIYIFCSIFILGKGHIKFQSLNQETMITFECL